MYNLIIIDDEKMIREGLSKTINWHELGIHKVYTASDGEEGFELICQHKIDLIITDIRMPGLNGLELLEALRTLHTSHKVIIISGFSDFKYAQKALQLGASDYILKPIEESVLIQQVTSCLLQLDEENSKTSHYAFLETSYNRSKQAYDQLIVDHITKGTPLKDIDAYYAYHKFMNSFSEYQMLVLYYDSGYLDITNINNLIEGDAFLLFENQPRELILIIGTENTFAPTYAKNLCDSLNESNDIVPIIGISNSFSKVTNLHPFYVEAMYAYSLKLFHKERYLFKASELKSFSITQPTTPVDEKLWLLFLANDKRSIDLLLQDTIKMHIYMTLDFKSLYLYMLSLLNFIARKQNSSYLFTLYNTTLNEDEILSNYMHILEKASNPIELYVVVKDLIYSFLDKENNVDSPTKLINEILLTVNTHLHEDITMNSTARMFYLSPSYFSKLFSDHVGMPFSKYLTKVRVEKAVELLSDPGLKVYQVSRLVGYKDSRYFIKVFKNHLSLTPVQYRDKYL